MAPGWGEGYLVSEDGSHVASQCPVEAGLTLGCQDPGHSGPKTNAALATRMHKNKSEPNRQDCCEVYFVGIIDFSIKYSIKKQAAVGVDDDLIGCKLVDSPQFRLTPACSHEAENLLRVAQGTGEKTSCVQLGGTEGLYLRMCKGNLNPKVCGHLC